MFRQDYFAWIIVLVLCLFINMGQLEASGETATAQVPMIDVMIADDDSVLFKAHRPILRQPQAECCAGWLSK